MCRVTFIRITLNSVTMRASPSPKRVSDILSLVFRVQRGTRLTFTLFLRLLGKLTAHFLPFLKGRHVFVQSDDTRLSNKPPGKDQVYATVFLEYGTQWRTCSLARSPLRGSGE